MDSGDVLYIVILPLVMMALSALVVLLIARGQAFM